MGPALALEYRNVLVPIVSRHESEAAMDLACRLATERGASVVALHRVGGPVAAPPGGGAPGARACRLATERGASIVALHVIGVPLELALDAELPEAMEERADFLLDEARAIGDAYGVNVIVRIVRARRPRAPRAAR